MKTLRQLCVASVFVFSLAIPAFAGEIQTTVAPPQQPAQASTTNGQPTANGEIETTVTGQIETTGSGEVSATDSATAAVLNLLQTVLALF
jgi:hypothetical protein